MAESDLTSRWWTAAALAIFILGLMPIALPVLEAGPTRAVARQDRPPRMDVVDDPHWDRSTRADLRFVVWQVARNSWTFAHRPAHLFDAEMCFPAERSLAYGPSGLTLGLLALPVRLFSDDPVLLFNVVQLGLLLISALILFWLVREWTGIPAAGIVAGAIFVFHYLKSGDLIHLYIRDTAWTMLALFFARRLFERPRWRDACGLAFAVSIHLSGDSYPMVAAALIAPFAGGWLWRAYGPSQLRPAQIGLVAVVVTACAVAFVLPYLVLDAGGDLGDSKFQVFAPLYLLAPGRPGFPGFTALALVVAAFALPARAATGGRHPNPRFALGGAILLLISCSVVIVPVSPLNVAILERGALPEGAWPNLYMLLERFVPGMSLGRGPGGIYIAAHMLLAVLAGFGAAALIRRAPGRWPIVAAVVLVALASVETLRPPALGFHPWLGYEAAEMRPDDETLALYEALADRMQTGAILELPASGSLVGEVSQSVLLSAYHGRPTSSCYASYLPQASLDVRHLASEMPDVDALQALYALGFTGLVVHHRPTGVGARRRRARYEAFATGPGAAWLEPVSAAADLSTYLIHPPSPDVELP